MTFTIAHTQKTQHGSETSGRRRSQDVSLGAPLFGVTLSRAGLRVSLHSAVLCATKGMGGTACLKAPSWLLGFSGSVGSSAETGDVSERFAAVTRRMSLSGRLSGLSGCVSDRHRRVVVRSRPRRVHRCEVGDLHVSRLISEEF